MSKQEAPTIFDNGGRRLGYSFPVIKPKLEFYYELEPNNNNNNNNNTNSNNNTNNNNDNMITDDDDNNNNNNNYNSNHSNNNNGAKRYKQFGKSLTQFYATEEGSTSFKLSLIAAFLKEHPYFRHLSDLIRNKIFHAFQDFTAQPGQILIDASDVGNSSNNVLKSCICLCLMGGLTCEVLDKETNTVTTQRISSGQHFNDAEFLSPQSSKDHIKSNRTCTDRIADNRQGSIHANYNRREKPRAFIICPSDEENPIQHRPSPSSYNDGCLR